MTESRKTEQQTEKPDVHSFGERLYAARNRLGLSTEEVAKSVNLTVEIIEAIERSDVQHLPQPAFVQGYIRVYARQVGVPVDVVLEEYSRAVPHARETVLRPRSVLPDETNSGSLLVKIVSMLLLVAVVLAAAYGIVSYYSEMVDTLAPEFEDDRSGSLELPYMEYPVEANEVISTDVEQPESSDVVGPNDEIEPAVEVLQVAEVVQEIIETPDKVIEERVLGQDTERAAMIETLQVAPGDDTLVFVAKTSSWVEVVDANGIRLQYDLVQDGRTVTLNGTAPFDVFLGNAPAMTVRLNNVQVNMTKYIRSNNIAHFKVSVSDSRVKFH